VTQPGYLTAQGNHLWMGGLSGFGRFRTTDHSHQQWLPPQYGGVRGITTAADGTVWFTSPNNDRIGRITPTSTAELSMTTWVDPEGEVDTPAGIAEGSDGNIWFADRGSIRIGRFNRATSAITTYTHPDLVRPESLIAGPDGNLWFTDGPGRQVGRITPAGVFTFFTRPGLGSPAELTTGPDGNIWFAILGGNQIARLDPDTGQITLVTDASGSIEDPRDIVAAQDCLWVFNSEEDDGDGGVTRVTTAGAVTRFPAPTINDAVRGSEGQLWLTGSGAVSRLQVGYFYPHSFTDVPAGAGYGRSLSWARSEGVIPGGTTFRPTDPMRRNGIVSLLFAYADSPGGSPAHGFADVPAGAAYRNALSWARAEGIVGAFPGNRFRPGQALTRVQAVTMLWKLAGSPTGNPAHGWSDVAAGNQAVRWAKARFIARGFPNGTFRPGNLVTRSQAVKMAYDLGMNPAAWSVTAPSAALF
jgi:streptogramin lyase